MIPLSWFLGAIGTVLLSAVGGTWAVAHARQKDLAEVHRQRDIDLANIYERMGTMAGKDDIVRLEGGVTRLADAMDSLRTEIHRTAVGLAEIRTRSGGI